MFLTKDPIIEIDGGFIDHGERFLTVVMGVATRRVVSLISERPSAESSLRAIRRFVADYGKPIALRHDHAKEYADPIFRDGLSELGIGLVAAPPFSGSEKSSAERVLGMVSRERLEETERRSRQS
ncbi:MAG TPA: hypothetical protein VMV27_02015 [Candidatus Binataceae bacterium]|nr:hypothetical protein [Candidatus Binataceae bacterium]